MGGHPAATMQKPQGAGATIPPMPEQIKPGLRDLRSEAPPHHGRGLTEPGVNSHQELASTHLSTHGWFPLLRGGDKQTAPSPAAAGRPTSPDLDQTASFSSQPPTPDGKPRTGVC